MPIYPDEFLLDLAKLGPLEGGYSNDPRDRGGETYRGLAKKWHPELWRNGQPDDSLVDACFYTDYWIRGGAVKIQNPRIRFELFEAGILCGIENAGMFLQEAYNVLQGATVLVVDGAVGPKTAAAVNGFCAVREMNRRALFAQQNTSQSNYFRACKSPAFIIGWSANRLGY